MQRSGTIVSALLLAAGGLVIALGQPSLAANAHRTKLRDDVYVLPPPAQLRAATLGYRAAAADILWANTLVQYGIRVHEKQPFVDLPKYLDAVLALDPTYRPLYKYCDTLIVFRPPVGTADDARLARKYLERGTRELPYDHEVWLHYGQFVAFLGPSFLTEKDEKERWRKEGAEAILHAVDLGADAFRALSAATILSKSGERTAAIAQLERAYALTDDPQTREDIAGKLQVLQANAERESAEARVRFVEARWKADYAFLTRGEFLMLGPVSDVASCAGIDAPRSRCAHDWETRLPAASSPAP